MSALAGLTAPPNTVSSPYSRSVCRACTRPPGPTEAEANEVWASTLLIWLRLDTDCAVATATKMASGTANAAISFDLMCRNTVAFLGKSAL